MRTLHFTDRQEINKIISACPICFVGMADTDGTPYVIPMNFGYNEDVIYLHSAPEGKNVDILSRNNKVCITFCTGHDLVYQHPTVACSYSMKSKSVLAMGNVTFIENTEEKVSVLNILMKQYSDREFTYSDPAVANVKIWKVEISQLTGKEFGVSYEKYKQHTKRG